jgi:replication initiator protein
VLWPTTVRLDPRYFESLTRHAVPLDERAVAALSHSAMGLDIYAWLAQRLHRVEIGKPTFIPWMSLKEQFGWHYQHMRKFKQVFRYTIDIVLTQYRAARVELDEHGMTLRNSPPPVKGRIAAIRRV